MLSPLSRASRSWHARCWASSVHPIRSGTKPHVCCLTVSIWTQSVPRVLCASYLAWKRTHCIPLRACQCKLLSVITIFWLLMIAINMMPARLFGEVRQHDRGLNRSSNRLIHPTASWIYARTRIYQIEFGFGLVKGSSAFHYSGPWEALPLPQLALSFVL